LWVADTSVTTQLGPLSVNKTTSDQLAIRLNDSILLPTDAWGIDIDRLSPADGPADFVLVFFNTGGTACAGLYRLIEVRHAPAGNQPSDGTQA